MFVYFGTLLILGVVLVLIADLLLRPGNFTIERITVVSGMPSKDHKRVQRIVWENINGNYFTVDLGGIERALEQVPGIYQATVRRIWPDRLRVTVQPSTALAEWQGFNQHGDPVERALINLSPDVLVTVVPRLAGSAGRQRQVLKMYLDTAKLLHSVGLEVARLRQGENGEWRAEVQFDSKRPDALIMLLLGRHHPVSRVKRFTRVFSLALSERVSELARVDLRYERGLAVSWRVRASATHVKS
jgi:cell division protein FtsQ